MKAMKAALMFCALAVLAGCGGGGDGGEPSVTTFPVAGPVRSVLSTSRTFSAGTVVNGANIRLTETFTPLPDAPFNGVTHKQTRMILQLTQNGVVVASETQTIYWESQPLTLQGFSGSVGSAEAVTDTAFPEQASVGQSGPAYHYSDGSSVTTVHWRLAQRTPSTAWFCLDYSGESVESDCYEADASGNVTGMAQFTVVVNGQTITLQ